MIGRYIPVHEYGFVALQAFMGGDEAIENAARQSYQSDSRGAAEREKLIRYLLEHGHTSPFEMVELQFHMALPIFVARQLIRHRTASVNEMSGRYTELPEVTYTPEEIRTQSKTNKQGASGVLLSEADYRSAVRSMKFVRDEAFSLYHELINEHDVARETARIDLPLSTYTIWTFKMDLHNFMRFAKLRTDPHAQKETRDYANVMASIAYQVAPMAMEAWRDFIFGSETFSRQEMLVLRKILKATPGDVDAVMENEANRMTERQRVAFGSKIAMERDFKFASLVDLLERAVSFGVAMEPFKAGVSK